ncbi:MAG: hypothetical protein IT340_00705 [Chloroflexi bacterium]|nr:hypothetical protein [Chloroflexota bacterium]
MITRNLIIATVALLIISVIIGILLFFAPTGLRQALRDILLIFLFLLTIFTMLMFLALTIAIFALLEMLNGRVVPLMDQVTQMINRVRGTTEFVSDEVVRPVITTAGTLARVRAMARAAVSKPPGASASPAGSAPPAGATMPPPPPPPAGAARPAP